MSDVRHADPSSSPHWRGSKGCVAPSSPHSAAPSKCAEYVDACAAHENAARTAPPAGTDRRRSAAARALRQHAGAAGVRRRPQDPEEPPLRAPRPRRPAAHPRRGGARAAAQEGGGRARPASGDGVVDLRRRRDAGRRRRRELPAGARPARRGGAAAICRRPTAPRRTTSSPARRSRCAPRSSIPIYDGACGATASGSRSRRSSRTRTATWTRWRPGSDAALPDWRPRLEPLLAAEEALFARFLARGRRRALPRIACAWRSSGALSAGDVPRHPARLRGRRATARTSRSPVGTINTNVRVETDGGPLFLRINEGKSRDDVRARGGHRRARRRARRADAGAARHGGRRAVRCAGRTSSSRCFRGSPGRTLARAELTPAHAAAVGRRAGPRFTCASAGFPDHRPGRYEPDEIDARLARIAALRASRAGAGGRGPGARAGAACAAERVAERADRAHSRRSVRRQRALRRRRRADRR